MKEFLKLQFEKFKGFFIKVQDNKNIPDFKRIIMGCFFLITLTLTFQLFVSEDISFIIKVRVKKGQSLSDSNIATNEDIDTLQKVRRKINYKYKAPQVIQGKKVVNGNTLPRGTKLIGKLGQGVDTRSNNGLVEVSLPYGGSYKGQLHIPKKSILIGSSQFQANGRVTINFKTVLFPSGEEYQIQAIALDFSDYSVGVIGNYHGRKLARVATSVILGAAGSAINSAGGSFSSARDENAFKREVQRNTMEGFRGSISNEMGQVGESMNQDNKDFVTLDRGKDLIIKLIRPFRKNYE